MRIYLVGHIAMSVWRLRECPAQPDTLKTINELWEGLTELGQSLGPVASHRLEMVYRFSLKPGTTFMLTLSPMVAVKLMVVAVLPRGLLLWRPTTERCHPSEVPLYLAKREKDYTSKLISYTVDAIVPGTEMESATAMVTCTDLAGNEVHKLTYSTATSLQRVFDRCSSRTS